MSAFKPHGEFTVEGSSVQVNQHKVDFVDDDVVEIRFSVVLCRRPTFYWMVMTWHDMLLSWNASQYGDLDFITVPQTKIWLPDYVIDNDVSAKRFLGNSDTLVFIRSSGLVTWEPGMVSETSCKIDTRKYPFDTQTCSFDFLPWMTTSRFLNTTVSSNKIRMSGFMPHGEFTIAGSSVALARFPTTFSDDDLVGISFSIVLSRRPAFYWMIMVFPMVTFPLLSPISFLVPVECGEKITLSITVLLSYLVFIGSLNDAMPKLSDTVSLMVIYASLQTTVSILIVVANGIIICVHKLPSDFQVTFPKFPKMSQMLVAIGEQKKYLPKGESLQSVTGNSVGLCPDDQTPDGAFEVEKNAVSRRDNWILFARRLDKICFSCFLCLTILVSVIFGILISQ
ncbi:neuronal acetylcholine receptor subunit alpha-10-like [Haliotis rufescens]|uniref:neuronal acetylcholine receptor subunit alpha-10-like n=1 Tax=Haliotis rufescens TaxID=6454 RepID=UPI00201EA03C|nr:neuronal acetylcholine receptor subunit alpha-10-like [Haliotis rufescens]